METSEEHVHDLLSIGQFSKLTHLTIKALRLYDRLGVLQPAVVDLSSGYRYYSPEQVSTAERIMLLRSLDMPLADIRTLLAETDPETLREHLVRHRQMIESRIASYHDGLALLQTLDTWAESVGKAHPQKEGWREYECAFCGKSNTAVNRMIAGAKGGLICDDCVGKCQRLLADHTAHSPDGETSS